MYSACVTLESTLNVRQTESPLHRTSPPDWVGTERNHIVIRMLFKAVAKNNSRDYLNVTQLSRDNFMTLLNFVIIGK
ncbi:UNVERIFIED_CONTAM: hypothetical protein NCL1_46205 [Trichonephila clavipes]